MLLLENKYICRKYTSQKTQLYSLTGERIKPQDTRSKYKYEVFIVRVDFIHERQVTSGQKCTQLVGN